MRRDRVLPSAADAVSAGDAAAGLRPLHLPRGGAEVVAESVAAPIEQQVNGVENMIYMESQSANDGSYKLKRDVPARAWT